MLFLAGLSCFAADPPPVNSAYVREQYTKFEHRIAMRDGVKLFVSVYIPKEAFTLGTRFPIMMMRTPYSVGPYGEDQYRSNLGPSELFAREKFIFVYEDVRGRYHERGQADAVAAAHAGEAWPARYR